KRIALTILQMVGIKSSDIVIGLTGFLVSIPVFCDSGFVILSSLAKELSRLTKKSMILIGGMLGMGLYITHFMVPPTPGPLAVAGAFKIDIGLFILYGLLISIPMFIVAVFYFRWVSSKHPDIIPPRDEEEMKALSPEQRAVLENIEAKHNAGQELSKEDFTALLKDDKLPGTAISFATLLIPVFLILLNTLCGLAVKNGVGIPPAVMSVVLLIGHPVCAVFISVLMATYMLCGSMPREEAVLSMEKSLADAGLIVFVTGAGGALGMVIRTTGAGDMMAQAIAGSSLPVILVPLLIGTLLRFPQGSGTVAMITGANILAPMLEAGLAIDPLIAGLALCTTAMFPSYLNDSYFWVVTRFSGFEVKTSLQTWTVGTFVIPFTASIILCIVNTFFF
ncbi:GntP family permease, partial [Desulfovibrio sp. OttesenSCG-928-O18]|nr:GntP family permease [Desulfovibrio sp. OttesenSCG-928-O18]